MSATTAPAVEFPEELIVDAAKESMLAQVLSEAGYDCVSASGLVHRIIEANDAHDDASRLRVPFVPDSVWADLAQVVSKSRSRSRRIAVVSPALTLLLPIWQHVMPSAVAVVPEPQPGSEEAVATAQYAQVYPGHLSMHDIQDPVVDLAGLRRVLANRAAWSSR